MLIMFIIVSVDKFNKIKKKHGILLEDVNLVLWKTIDHLSGFFPHDMGLITHISAQTLTCGDISPVQMVFFSQ